MKIFYKGKDISTLVKKVTWSGSRLQVARKLVFDYVQDDRDPNIPVLTINMEKLFLDMTKKTILSFEVMFLM